MVLNEIRLCLIPLDPNKILHLNDPPIGRILVFAWAHQLVNEELGCLGDVRFRLLCYVVDLGSQGDSKLSLLSLDLINREDVGNMDRA
jgi:hypothetical protein